MSMCLCSFEVPSLFALIPVRRGGNKNRTAVHPSELVRLDHQVGLSIVTSAERMKTTARYLNEDDNESFHGGSKAQVESRRQKYGF